MLTPRQQIFVWHYGLTGRAERSAIAAGTNPASARTRAYRWLKKTEIQERIEELRQEHFCDLREEISTRLCRAISLGLKSGLNYPETRRALKLLERIGVFRFTNAVQEFLEKKVEAEAQIEAEFEAASWREWQRMQRKQKRSRLRRAANQTGLRAKVEVVAQGTEGLQG